MNSSFTKAAQLLQLTDPVVVQQIEKLELIVGSKIIDRKLWINLTESGQEILRSAQRLLSINDKIIFECAASSPCRSFASATPNLFAGRAAEDRRANSV